MGSYLDRLNRQYDEITNGITALIDRAADEDRDVTDAEQAQVDRDRGRLDDLRGAIEHYTALESQNGKVQELRRTVPAAPAQTRTAREPEAEYDVAREFPTPGDYAVMIHRATALRDPAAVEQLNRATAHQTTADNAGIIPRPVLGPVLNFLNSGRPFINSITNRPLPAGKFDRPRITQHVAVGKQDAEKTLTESQKMLIDDMPVTASTYAGHLNISRQNIKWSSPSILNIVYDDFAAMYAIATDEDAATQFVTGVAAANPPVEIPGPTRADIAAAFYNAAAGVMDKSGQGPDTLWCSPDVWAQLGSATTTQDIPAFPSLSLTSAGGNPMGLRLVVDPHFPAATMIMGPSRLAEWYEDLDGLMQVGEPDVLGQLVGYAGYGAFINVDPSAFFPFTFAAPTP